MKNIRSEIGGRIKKVRDELGLNQKDFGDKFGKSKSAVSNWEKGDALPPIETMYEIEKLGEKPRDWVLTGVAEEGIKYGAAESQCKLSPEEEKLLEAMREFPEAQEAMEIFLRLPKNKQRIQLGKMYEELEKVEGGKE